MAILTHKLTDKECRNAQPKSAHEPTMLSDGNGLFLQVTPSRTAGSPPARSWMLVYRRPSDRKKVRLGLGSLKDVSLAEAREESARMGVLLDKNIDPQSQRKREKLEQEETARELNKANVVKEKTAQAQRDSFITYARKYIDAHKGEGASAWNPSHAHQWKTTLGLVDSRDNAVKITKEFGNIPCSEIDQDHVLALLKPFWNERTVTADRLRNRIELVLNFWAAVNKIKGFTNPAAKRLLKECGLSSPDAIHIVEHHPALPHDKVTWCLNQVRNNPQIAARALELAIFIPMRRAAIVGTRWKEIDFETRTWTIPKERMKGKGIKRQEHKTHLSKPVIGMLLHMREQLENPQPDDFVFPQYRATWTKPRAMDKNAPYKLLKQIDPTVTFHGLRTTFVQWCELPIKPNPQTLEDARSQVEYKVVKACLAHKNTREDKSNAATNAYFRDDFLELRRPVLEAWSRYCEGRQLRLVAAS
jgi:integrase